MKTFSKIILYLLILTNILVVFFFFLLLYPFKVVKVNSIEILTPIVKVGGQVSYKINFCKYFAVAGQAQRKLVNHYEYFLAQETVNDKGKECGEKKISIYLPTYIDGGIYHIHTDLKHTIFGIRTIDTHYETPNFQIVR